MSRAARTRRRCRVLLAAVAAASAVGAPAQAQNHVPSEGPGGPILVIADPADPFGRYYAEILRAEGLNEFAVTTTGAVDAQSLAAHQVVLVAGGNALGDAQVAALTQWVQSGGNLIAMRPGPRLAPLLGLGAYHGPLSEGYMKIDTGRAPGAGLTDETLQFHGTADRWSPADTASVATLYADAGTPTASPAVTLRSVGTAGGQAAAFTYDLARSVVYTRQGNPAWAGDKRDTTTDSIRPADLFYGAKAGDVQPDWIDFGRIAIPQADEQQRLLANLVTTMSLDRAPLPRFWYLPRGERAAVVMTGDDHANGGTDDQFETFKAKSRPGCSVALWQCVRATSYLYAGSPLTDGQAHAYQAEGFEAAMHLSLGACDVPPPASLDLAWQENLQNWTAQYTVGRPRTNRTHCVKWSDWAGMAKAELAHGVRFDTNYQYAAQAFVQDRPGLFTGSGFPMRFADENGAIIDVYQAATQLSDEAGIDYAKHITALLDGALGDVPGDVPNAVRG